MANRKAYCDKALRGEQRIRQQRGREATSSELVRSSKYQLPHLCCRGFRQVSGSPELMIHVNLRGVHKSHKCDVMPMAVVEGMSGREAFQAACFGEYLVHYLAVSVKVDT